MGGGGGGGGPLTSMETGKGTVASGSKEVRSPQAEFPSGPGQWAEGMVCSWFEELGGG